jgi:hypothetical protein
MSRTSRCDGHHKRAFSGTEGEVVHTRAPSRPAQLRTSSVAIGGTADMGRECELHRCDANDRL